MMTKEDALRKIKGYLTDLLPIDDYDEVEELMKALEQEPCEDAKQKLIKDCQPPTDDWEQYMDRLHDIAYKNGYEQAKKDYADKLHDIAYKRGYEQAKKDAEALFRKARNELMESDRKEHINDFNTRDLMLLNAEQIIHLLLLPPVSPALEPCEDAISRQAVLKQLKGCLTGGDTEYEYVKLHIDSIPPVSPARPKGEWIDNPEDGYVECPFCHSATTCGDNIDELHYCFSCGAEMRQAESEG